MADPSKVRVDVLMIGTGEYTTGYVHGKASQSDKSKGGTSDDAAIGCVTVECLVVALTLIDLRRRGKTGRLGMCGTNGKKFPDIRKYMQQAIGDVYQEMDLSMDWWYVVRDRSASLKFENLGLEMIQATIELISKRSMPSSRVMPA